METNPALSAALDWAASERGIKDAIAVDTAHATEAPGGERLQRLLLASGRDASATVRQGSAGRQ